MISPCDNNLSTKFNERKLFQEMKTVKAFEFKNIHEATSKNVAITEKKDKQYARQINVNLGHLPTKVTPGIVFVDEPFVQYNVPIVKNTFATDCK